MLSPKRDHYFKLLNDSGSSKPGQGVIEFTIDKATNTKFEKGLLALIDVKCYIQSGRSR